jgi:predicted membrane-bound spermidine synthase
MMSEFAEWDSFYVIVGSAAGALIGLQFVVMTLIAERPPARAADAGAAFATPTIVHFSVVLLLSALLRAPWLSVVPIAALWGLIGLSGVVYTAIVARRMNKQSALCALAPRGSFPRARSPVCRWRRYASVALRGHSQRLGCRRLPCACE